MNSIIKVGGIEGELLSFKQKNKMDGQQKEKSTTVKLVQLEKDIF